MNNKTMEKILQKLVSTGLYGSTIEEVKEELIKCALLKIIDDELLLKFDRYSKLSEPIDLNALTSNENK